MDPLGYGSKISDMDIHAFGMFTSTEPIENRTNNSITLSAIPEVLEEKKNFVALFLLIIPMMTVFGNLLVVLSVYRERTLRTATNYLIISLAISDLLVALCVMPFAVYVEVHNGLWRLPKSLCTCYTAIDVMASTASILNLVAISWDRYMAVSKPIEYAQSRHRKNRRVLVMIASVWSTALVIALPMATGLNRLDDTQYCEFTNTVYIIASSIASFFLPCVLMVALYSVVLRKLRQRQEQRSKTNGNTSRYESKIKRQSQKKPQNSTLFRNSVITENESASTNELSVVSPTRLKANNPEFMSESLLGMTQSPQMVTSSTPLTIPTRTSPCCGELFINAVEFKDDWSNNNNNMIMTIANVGLSEYQQTPYPIDRHRLTPTAFEMLELDSESVPFIDSSSVQVTPRRQKKFSSQLANVHLNGKLVISPSTNSMRANSICVMDNQLPSPLRVIANASAKEASPIPQRKRATTNDREFRRMLTSPIDLRRHSVADEKAIASARYRDRGCVSENADTYNKRMASVKATVAAAAAARYSRQSRKERRATLTLAVVLVVFLCCWLPFFTCHVTNSICMVISKETCIDIVAFFFTTWLGYTNSFMNPMIYTIFNPEYRRAFRNILCCKSAGHR